MLHSAVKAHCVHFTKKTQCPTHLRAAVMGTEHHKQHHSGKIAHKNVMPC